MAMITQKQSAPDKAINTDKWTEIMFRALTSRVSHRWKFQNFRGKKKRESAGIADILCVRRDATESKAPPLKRYDLFEFVLVQLKGGLARKPKEDELARLWSMGSSKNLRCEGSRSFRA